MYISLLESCFAHEVGFEISTDDSIRKDAFLFGESQGRIIVSIKPEDEQKFIESLEETDTPYRLLGSVTSGDITIDDASFGVISDLKNKFSTALGELLA